MNLWMMVLHFYYVNSKDLLYYAFTGGLILSKTFLKEEQAVPLTET